MRTAPLIGVLALQGDVREHLAALELGGARAIRVRRPAELDGVDGVVVPGGESTTIGKLAGTFGMLDPLRAAVRAGLPMYGSCAGMILLADRIVDGTPGQQLIGGIDMTVRRNAFGRQVDSFEQDLLLVDLGEEPVHAVFIRAPWAEQVGDGVEVLARTGGGGAARAASDGAAPTGAADRIVAVRQGALLATSFHPELAGDTRVHALFVQMVRERS